MEYNNNEETKVIKFVNREKTNFYFLNNKYKIKNKNKASITYICTVQKCYANIRVESNNIIVNEKIAHNHEPLSDCETNANIRLIQL